MRKFYFLLGVLCTVIFNVALSQQYVWVPTGSTTSNTIPFAGTTNLRQWVYYPSEFPTAPSGNITDIYIKASASVTPSFSNLTIKMGATTINTFTAGPYVSGLQTVYSGSYTASTVTGDYVKITLQTPFYYDNTQNFIIEASQTGYSPGFSVMQATSGAVGRSIMGASTATSGSVQDRLADFGFDLVLITPCVDPPTAGSATVSNASPCPSTNVTLNLTGNTQGIGQTYQWESSSSASGPWVLEGSSSSIAALTVLPPTGTTYYRCQVTCSSAPVASTPVVVSVPSSYSGNYTIDATQTASPTNFQSFSDALSVLTCTGISGNVVLNVAPGSGPYTGQLIIGAIPGASPSATVTIKGNGETVSYTSTASATRPTILLNGAKYITIDSLNIQANGATYGWGVHLTNNADNDTIKNCTMSITSTSTTAANTGGVIISGSGTSITTAGNSDNIVVMNNIIIGGYQGIIMRGATTTPLANNVVSGNIIQDQYAVGIEALYTINTIISNNDISRPLRTTTTTYAGIELGTGNVQAMVNSNKIHSTHTSMTTQSGTAYGIYLNDCDAAISQENIIANNLIYNFNSINGLQNGLRNVGSDGAYFYNNTVVHNNPTSTSGVTYPFYQATAATNIEVKNNVFYVTRSGGGTKHCLYMNTAASSIVSNNNVLYMNAPGGVNYIGRSNGNDRASLVLWQGDGFDLASSDQDPIFQNAAALDYTTTNTVVNNIGVPIASITTDINGVSRSATSPDPGAFENNTPPLDVKLLSLSASKLENDVVVKWAVAAEKNMNVYEVERSNDGKHFNKIGIVKAESKNTKISYDYKDRNIIPANPKLYYRLRMIEDNGAFVYSPVKKVIYTEEIVTSVSMSPNPFNDRIAIRLISNQEANANVIIIDLHGKILLSNNYNIQKGINNLQVQKLDHLPSSVYYLVIDIDGEKFVQSIVK